MNFSLELIKLITLGIPGFIGLMVLGKLIKYHNRHIHIHIIEIIVLSIFSYVFFDFFTKSPNMIHNNGFSILKLIENSKDSAITLDYSIIMWASLTSVLIAFTLSFIHTTKLITAIGRFLRVTKRYGDEEVWDYYFNGLEDAWVVVKDQRTNTMYFGYVQVFSDWGDLHELLLYNADIYKEVDNEWIHHYSVNSKYLCRNKGELDIEVHHYDNTEINEEVNTIVAEETHTEAT